MRYALSALLVRLFGQRPVQRGQFTQSFHQGRNQPRIFVERRGTIIERVLTQSFFNDLQLSLGVLPSAHDKRTPVNRFIARCIVVFSRPALLPGPSRDGGARQIALRRNGSGRKMLNFKETSRLGTTR